MPTIETKGVTVLNAIAILLLCQLAGEMLVHWFGWPLPGPVLGMLFLLGGLIYRKRSSHSLDTTTDTLLKYLALLFVPAGVGLMNYLGLIGREWIALGVTLLASIVITLVVTGMTMQWLLRRQQER